MYPLWELKKTFRENFKKNVHWCTRQSYHTIRVGEEKQIENNNTK